MAGNVTVVTRKEWPWGLYCAHCGRQIPFGDKVFWHDLSKEYSEASCEMCEGAP